MTNLGMIQYRLLIITIKDREIGICDIPTVKYLVSREIFRFYYGVGVPVRAGRARVGSGTHEHL